MTDTRTHSLDEASATIMAALESAKDDISWAHNAICVFKVSACLMIGVTSFKVHPHVSWGPLLVTVELWWGTKQVLIVDWSFSSPPRWQSNYLMGSMIYPTVERGRWSVCLCIPPSLLPASIKFVGQWMGGLCHSALFVREIELADSRLSGFPNETLPYTHKEDCHENLCDVDIRLSGN